MTGVILQGLEWSRRRNYGSPTLAERIPNSHPKWFLYPNMILISFPVDPEMIPN